ncbi:hypothetical protein NPIL_244721 [Nephila pilipes]|uniref:Uncharacterized protein n=1 Tax=Nephila pilipes TaxID=299642 RepID=A0A8X6QFE6_NEPPI|nr:hypothetical protein NPIL_244721 [Nephila pilipes]
MKAAFKLFNVFNGRIFSNGIKYKLLSSGNVNHLRLFGCQFKLEFNFGCLGFGGKKLERSGLFLAQFLTFDEGSRKGSGTIRIVFQGVKGYFFKLRIFLRRGGDLSLVECYCGFSFSPSVSLVIKTLLIDDSQWFFKKRVLEFSARIFMGILCSLSKDHTSIVNQEFGCIITHLDSPTAPSAPGGMRRRRGREQFIVKI